VRSVTGRTLAKVRQSIAGFDVSDSKGQAPKMQPLDEDNEADTGLSGPEKKRQKRNQDWIESQQQLFNLQFSREKIQEMLKDKSMKQALTELKRYRKPQYEICTTVVNVYCTLIDVKMWQMLPIDDETKIRLVPKHENAQIPIWKEAAKRIIPVRLLRMMETHDPMKDLSNGDGAVIENGVNLTSERFKTIEQILKEVSQVDAASASLCAGLIREWTYVMHEMTKCLEHQKNLEAEGIDVDVNMIPKQEPKNLIPSAPSTPGESRRLSQKAKAENK